VTGQLRAELLKQRSTQTTFFLLLGMVGLVALAGALHVLAPSPSSLASLKHQLQVFEVGTRVGMLFAGLVGAMAITAEIRYGTIRPTFLVTPRRGPVIAAKLVISALAGILFGLVAEGLMAGATTVALWARGIDNQLASGDYLQLLAGGTGAAALWAMIGLGVGALVRNQVATLVGLCAWMLLVENLLLPFVPDAGRLTPGAAGLALAGSIADKLLTPAPAAFMLAFYAIAAAAGGWLATLRRDLA
jgi:ABC-type transport system involved in multi-copper enzyme maturation permease subunit